MFYLSQLIGKSIYFQKQRIGTVVDLVALEKKNILTASSLLVKKGRSSFTITLEDASFKQLRWEITTPTLQKSVPEKNSFFLSEDLLDKQVIDINGRRLVRVNDVLLKKNGKLNIEGIDIGFSGVVRRLGLPNVLGLKTITLPWSVIEAFDYETGNIQIKLTQNRLNTFHPAEIAEILEEAGTKERLGILDSLDAQKAAAAIEEANDETQSAILEQVSTTRLKTIVDRMHLSEVADILATINPFTSKKIISSLGRDKANKLQKLLVYQDDEAGGIMEVSFLKATNETTVEELLKKLSDENIKPESVIITDSRDKFVGTINTKNLINAHPTTRMKQIEMSNYSAHQNDSFSDILKLFAHYNMRTLPVVSAENTVQGIIKIDSMLTMIHEEGEREDAL